MGRTQSGSLKVLLACVAAWAIPGAGHLLLRRWGRAALFCMAILSMFALGLAMDGRLFSPAPDFFTLLKFVADGGVGLAYFIARSAGYGVGDVTSATYDYGNVFIYVAGLLNMLVILDAYDIAVGRKS